MRLLFSVNNFGFLRNFEHALRALAARGHHLHLLAERADAVGGTRTIEGLQRDFPSQVTWAFAPSRKQDLWQPLALQVRRCLDYWRYLDPQYERAFSLRERAARQSPGFASALPRVPVVGSRPAMRVWRALFRAIERALPAGETVERILRAQHPDILLLTPLLYFGSQQVEYVRAARALGIRSVLGVGSWDHLTTKGLIRVRPDLITVWNREQQAEAVEFHGIDPERIVVTGAQPFDRWFERTPTDRALFCRKIGLSADRPIVLFVGSTASISAPDAELYFVRRWIAALRAVPELAEVGILIRPHPYNSTHWREADFSDLPNVAIYPRGANPVNEADRQDYFDSLFHADTVVGVNTTAMIEAAIVGRTVHSVLAPEFEDTQGGTLHFRYLLVENGGFLRVAQSLPEHAGQVAETVQAPEIGRAACARFVERFVRPFGREVPATPVIVEALERLALTRRERASVPAFLYPLQRLLKVAGDRAVQRERQRRAAAARNARLAARKRGDTRAINPADAAADVGTKAG